MNEMIEKVTKCIRTLNSISIPVGLQDQITVPIMMTVNELAEIREELSKVTEEKSEE